MELKDIYQRIRRYEEEVIRSKVEDPSLRQELIEGLEVIMTDGEGDEFITRGVLPSDSGPSWRRKGDIEIRPHHFYKDKSLYVLTSERPERANYGQVSYNGIITDTVAGKVIRYFLENVNKPTTLEQLMEVSETPSVNNHLGRVREFFRKSQVYNLTRLRKGKKQFVLTEYSHSDRGNPPSTTRR